jgi:thiamine biosynthesis lipoprotein
MKGISNIVCISLLSFIISSCGGERGGVIKRTTIVMGSTIEIQVKCRDENKANNAITAAFAEARRIDTLFSTYLKDNNMWKINNSSTEKLYVNKETFYILKKSGYIWEITEGAFDVAIGNIIDLVGFDKNSPKVPSYTEVLKATENIGWKKIKLEDPDILFKPKNIKINFNAIVPGYAADKCAKILEDNGISDYLINVGGELFSKGEEWKIGIQHPRMENELIGTISASGYGVATSGDYQQYFKKNGKRFTHIFNPATGYSANECEAVTIIAPDAITADALSTGIFVLGPQKGLALIEKLDNVEGIIVDTTGTIHESSGFKNFLKR